MSVARRLISSGSSGSGGVAGITGTPTETARLRAATLLPSVRMVSGLGPMKIMPAPRRLRRIPGSRRESRSPDGSRRSWRPGDPDHLVDGQIGLEGSLAAADLIGFVRLETVQRELVLLGIDRDRCNAQFGRRAEHPNGDFAAIGDE